MLIVGGVNVVLQGRTAEQILQDILNFQRAVLSMCVNPSAGEISSVAVPTVTFPPMATAVPGEYRAVDADKLQALIDFTTGIREIIKNAVNSITGLPLGEYTTPTFHIWGRKGGATDNIISPRNLMESTQEVRCTEWREEEYDKMLHLKDGARLRMGMSCTKYFQGYLGCYCC